MSRVGELQGRNECYDVGMKLIVFLIVVGALSLLQGCMVEEEPNNANFRWTTNNNMPVAPKQTTYGSPTDKYSSPTSDTKYRSKGFNDVMGH